MLQIGKSVVIVLVSTGAVYAAPITVVNSSFELPAVIRDDQNPFGALPFIDDWDETASGDTDEFHQDTGVFLNTDSSSPDHITNAHLERLAFVNSAIGNDLRQQLAANYISGNSYEMTVAVGTSAMFPVGSAEELEIAFAYIHGGTEHIISSATILGSQVNPTSLVDVVVTIPEVFLQNEWANLPIILLIRPATDDGDDLDGEGFWNVDNVRVVPEPATIMLLTMGGLFAVRGGRKIIGRISTYTPTHTLV